MRLITVFLLLAGAGIITWLVLARPNGKGEMPKQQAINQSKYSASFNSQITGLMNDYYKVEERLVNWDSASAATAASTLIKDLDNTLLTELKKDSSLLLTAQTFIDNAKGDAATIQDEKTIRPQREAFNSLTDNLYQFLNTVKYDREKLYLQECPMAFDDTKHGLWISKDEAIRNPYLGLHHPKYGKAMLECGETKQVINHTGTDGQQTMKAEADAQQSVKKEDGKNEKR